MKSSLSYNYDYDSRDDIFSPTNGFRFQTRKF